MESPPLPSPRRATEPDSPQRIREFNPPNLTVQPQRTGKQSKDMQFTVLLHGGTRTELFKAGDVEESTLLAVGKCSACLSAAGALLLACCSKVPAFAVSSTAAPEQVLLSAVSGCRLHGIHAWGLCGPGGVWVNF